MPPLFPRNVLYGSPFTASQISTSPFKRPAARSFPSGLNARPRTLDGFQKDPASFADHLDRGRTFCARSLDVRDPIAAQMDRRAAVVNGNNQVVPVLRMTADESDPRARVAVRRRGAEAQARFALNL